MALELPLLNINAKEKKTLELHLNTNTFLVMTQLAKSLKRQKYFVESVHSSLSSFREAHFNLSFCHCMNDFKYQYYILSIVLLLIKLT